MTGKRYFGLSIFVLVIIGLAFAVSAQDDADTEALIENALSAAPEAIAEGAAVHWTDEAGELVVLREGTNGWICYPDWTVSPGNDPACNDEVWEEFFATSDEELAVTEVGIAYMLQGGSDPSNTDPSAMEPAEGEDWIRTPPHIMILLPTGMDLSMITTDHMSGEPYVMWAGTPRQHIMVPVDAVEMDH
jgi:hypothetical protein